MTETPRAVDTAPATYTQSARPTRLRSSILVRRALLIAAPILAGLLAVVGAVADPAAGVSGPEMWRLYAEHPEPLQWKSFGLHWAFTFMALPAIGAFAFIRHRGAWLANVAGLAGIVGIAMIPGMLIVDFYDSAIGQVAGAETTAEVYARLDGMWAVNAMVLPGNIALLLALPLAAIAYWRAGYLRWWGFAATVLGLTALWLSGFAWWGAAIFALASVVLGAELAFGVRRIDKAGLPSA